MRRAIAVAALLTLPVAGAARADVPASDREATSAPEPDTYECALRLEPGGPWTRARGFSFSFGSVPTEGVLLTGATLEYARRYGTTIVRGEYTYGVLKNEPGATHPNGIMHRGEVSVRLPIFGVGPRYDGGLYPGTFFVEGGIGHSWNRWRDGTTDSGFDATASLGLMISGPGSRTLVGASKVKLIVSRTDDGPDVICAAGGDTGCASGADGGYGFGIMATWGVSLGN